MMLYTPWMAKIYAMNTSKNKAARRKYYWYLLEIAGIIINWNPNYWILNSALILIQMILNSYLLGCFCVSIFKAVDLMGMCIYLNFSALLLLAMFMNIVWILQQEKLLYVTSVGDEVLFEYGSSLRRSNEIKLLNENGAKMRKIMFIAAPSWISLIALSVMLSDVVDAAFSYPKSNETVINGIQQMLPCKMWVYHQIDNEFVRIQRDHPQYCTINRWLTMRAEGLNGKKIINTTVNRKSIAIMTLSWWLTILIQAVCSGSTAMVIGSADLIMFFGGQHLIIQLKILNMAILDTDKRAAKLYETETGRKPPSDPIEKTKDRQLMGFYKFCLKQTVEHHKVILRYAAIYGDLVNWPCGLVVVAGSIVVAMSMVSIMQGGGQPSVLVTSFLLIVAEIASLFMVCEIGETITSICRELFDSMYEFSWMDCSVEVGKSISIAKSGMRKPIILTAGSLTPIDRDTFGAMMNTAYSYMNLVKASGAADSQ